MRVRVRERQRIPSPPCMGRCSLGHDTESSSLAKLSSFSLVFSVMVGLLTTSLYYTNHYAYFLSHAALQVFFFFFFSQNLGQDPDVGCGKIKMCAEKWLWTKIVSKTLPSLPKPEATCLVNWTDCDIVIVLLLSS